MGEEKRNKQAVCVFVLQMLKSNLEEGKEENPGKE